MYVCVDMNVPAIIYTMWLEKWLVTSTFTETIFCNIFKAISQVLVYDIGHVLAVFLGIIISQTIVVCISKKRFLWPGEKVVIEDFPWCLMLHVLQIASIQDFGNSLK